MTAAPALPVAALSVEVLAADQYRVRGGAVPHVVTVAPDAIACDCPDRRYRRRMCKHMWAVTAWRARDPLNVADHTAVDPLLEALYRETDTLYRRLDVRLARLERPTPWGAPVVPPTSVAYPALHLWRQEVRRGYRGQHADRPATWQFDALWRAACWEARASAASSFDAEALRRAREAIAETVEVHGA